MKLRILTLALASAASPALAQDFGSSVDAMLAAQSMQYFGIAAPLAASAPSSFTPYRTAGQTASDQIALAGGLTASYLTRDVADSLDMMAFFPADNPTHIIGCIEGDREEIAAGKLNPSVQSISLADGTVSTLLRGMVACDGIRTSPWGTVIATEEEDDGGVYEILDPLLIDNVVISDRATGAVSDPAHVAKRTAMAVIAWEGFVMTPEGVVYGGDELRPGTDAPDADGGALFKFIPATLYSGGMIASLDQSPLVAGTSYALQVSCQGASVQAGQGCEIGKGWWVEIDPATARASAFASHAAGYYRPEDLHQDPLFAGPGIRMCGANTGNEGASNYAEVMCYIDSEPTLAPAPDADGKVTLSAEANRFVEGDPDFNSMDNLAFQPGTGILYVIEDHENGDIFACLPDGGDRDIKTDGCIKMLSVKDSSAEPTGFIFTPDGMTAYVSIQHSDDANMSPLDDYGTDDLVVITGFARPAM